MHIKKIIQEIHQLPLQKKFYVMEQTLKSIKNEELKSHTELAIDETDDDHDDDKEISLSNYIISEKSLSNDWISKEDNRWDKLL